MASDELVWDIINNQFCSFKIKTAKEQAFCRNEYNVSGYCSKQHCPLANSRYATVRSDPATGRLYLYMKTSERAHTPNKWWERVRLPSNYNRALDMIDERLIYWPKPLVHKCKQRLTRLTQVSIRTRSLKQEDQRLGERLVPKLAPKVQQRESTREKKAESAAKVERAIERELIERLRSGAYGDHPLNVEEAVWKKVMRGLERIGEGISDEIREEFEEEDEDFEKEVEYERETPTRDIEFVSSEDDSDSGKREIGDFEDWLGNQSSEENASGSDEDSGITNDENDDFEDGFRNSKRKKLSVHNAPPNKRFRNGPKREIEYEIESAEKREQMLGT